MFRVGGADAAARDTWLDALADTAMEAQAAGSVVIGTSVSGGSSASFEVLKNWSPSDILSLIDAARTWAQEDDVESALALIGQPIDETHFECGLER